MSDYVSIVGLEERVGATRLGQLCGVEGAAKAALLENLIARAEAAVNAYLSKRYRVPVPVGPLVREWSLDIAEHELYKRGPGGDVPDKIRNARDNALQQLREVAKGDLNLPDASPSGPLSPTGRTLVVASAPPLFDAAGMDGF